MTSYGNVQVVTIVNGPLQENCFLVIDGATRHAVLIDPGDEASRMQAVVADFGAKVDEIWGTHGHIDHVGAVAELQRALGAKFWFHPLDVPWLDGIDESARALGIPLKPRPTVDGELCEGMELRVGETTAKVLYTPGHSLGGCCFYFAKEKMVFVGDTLFAGSIGRTDFPGGSYATLLSSIRAKLLPLDDDVVVLPGHGPATTIGVERRSNRFLR